MQELYPGYFALVMATGILSTGTRAWQLPAASLTLGLVAAIAYISLLTLSALRAVRFPRRVWQDLNDARVNLTFFTLVAASCVLAVRLVGEGWTVPARGLWFFALLVEVVLTYSVATSLIVGNTRPAEEVLHGGWLIWVVSIQSLVIAALDLARAGMGEGSQLVAAWMGWTFGTLLYALLAGMILYRLFFRPVRPADLNPTYWVTMGAAAISTVAGARLLDPAGWPPLLEGLRPFTQAVTLGLWAWGSWWVSELMVLWLWKHGFQRAPLVYEPALWSTVFPLGMYSVATLEVARITGWPLLARLSYLVLWIALAAWGLTTFGLLQTWARGVLTSWKKASDMADGGLIGRGSRQGRM